MSLAAGPVPFTVKVLWGDPASIGKGYEMKEVVYPIAPVTAQKFIKWFKDKLEPTIVMDVELAWCFAFTRLSGVVPENVRRTVFKRTVEEFGEHWHESMEAVSEMVTWFKEYARTKAKCPQCGAHETLEGTFTRGFRCGLCHSEWFCKDPWKARWLLR